MTHFYTLALSLLTLCCGACETATETPEPTTPTDAGDAGNTILSPTPDAATVTEAGTLDNPTCPDGGGALAACRWAPGTLSQCTGIALLQGYSVDGGALSVQLCAKQSDCGDQGLKCVINPQLSQESSRDNGVVTLAFSCAVCGS